ncbi:MAG TPA: phosphatidylglycerol lysyltransferase domain-containing protein [Acidimicrobiales bacterium]|nr:phosphatidylglycerol lysyltransferase domain-containing protein [Acidimicrobiales bacterium]
MSPAPDELDAARLERTRRIASVIVFVAGAANLASAATPPMRAGLHLVLELEPLVVSQTAGALVALSALVLLALARGVRRGQRQAWLVSCALLAGTALLHLVKGIELTESAMCLGALVWLVARRRSFTTSVDRPSRSLAVRALLVGVVLTTALATLAVEVSLLLDPDNNPIPPLRAVAAVAERLVGVQTIALPHRVDVFLAPSLLAAGLGLAGFALALVSRPVVDRRRRAGTSSRRRARELVRRHGAGTLDYFALRDDKQHFFDGETLVTYAVYGGVCLVSPDPIGPRRDRARAWSRFCRFADTKGWNVAVLGAADDWLATYRAAGMHDIYVGDEAIVDLASFDLQGGRSKGLRQAVNRIARHGYTVAFHGPGDCDEHVAEALRDVMTKSRRGGRERGFSMTLGRLCDPDDDDLLIAVARDPDGRPVAFCQYVPAPGIGGYSLDLMRRDDGEHPNGLTDFVIVSTIAHLRSQGMQALGLNFATMRAVLAGEGDDSTSLRLKRWLLRRMSGSMQIESLWRFNAKYHPRWIGRYVIYRAPEHLPAVAVAIARAESFWELPVIGRFLGGERDGRYSAPAGEAEGARPHEPVAAARVDAPPLPRVGSGLP